VKELCSFFFVEFVLESEGILALRWVERQCDLELRVESLVHDVIGVLELEGDSADRVRLVHSWVSQLQQLDSGNQLSDRCAERSEVDFSEVSFFKQNVGET
jgi:hypothetical protein